MTQHPFHRFVLLAAFLATGLLHAVSTDAVTVSATAIREYVRPMDPAGGPRPESYIFSPGQFFDGSTVDGGLVKVTFNEIVRTLAVNLARQKYFPTKAIADADLLIVVHWGTTTIYEDPQKELNNQALQEALSNYNAAIEASGTTDPTALNMELDAKETADSGTLGAINRNAILLGYGRKLQKERRADMPSAAEITMSNELNEERYFVILMAYDNRLRVKEHKSKLLWVTRLSVRSPGNNFTDAMPTLARVGADVYGKHVDDLVRVKTPIQRGSIKLGELEVLGITPDKPDKPAEPEKKDK